MSYTYERTINYYETDKMGVVHHANYIKFLEESRIAYLKEEGMPFESWEEKGITIPVLSVNCKYLHHVTFSDTILINVSITKYSGVRATISYNVTDKKTGSTVITAETTHCFTNRELKPVNLKKYCPEYGKKFEDLQEQQLQG